MVFSCFSGLSLTAYAATVSPENSGTVEVVEDGDNWKFTATPASGYEFDMMISVSPRTLIISSAITLGVSILVSFLFRRKINKLNMVEALKGVE